MSTNVKVMSCTPDDVFAVLDDGWLFPSWVVGASRMRDVDKNWPQAGTKLEHSFGVWPLVIDDETRVLDYDPPRLLRIRPKGWPIGEAEVTIEVKPRGDDCIVRITEFAVEGPGVLVPKPLMDVALKIRNTETLRRLAFMAEGRRRGSEVAS